MTNDINSEFYTESPDKNKKINLLIHSYNQNKKTKKIKAKNKTIININFIDGARSNGHGPEQAQIATKQALLSYAKDSTKTCESVSNLSGTPKYFTDLPFNIQHNIIRNSMQISIQVNNNEYDKFEDKFDLIYMTAVFNNSKPANYFLDKVFPNIKVNNTIYLMGSNVPPEIVSSFRRSKNQYYLAVEKFYKLSKKASKYSILGYIPNPLNEELLNIANYYISTESNSKTKSRKQCIVYVKKNALLQLEAIRIGERYNCKLFKYGDYKRNDLLSIAPNAKFVIISDKWETQGYAYMELMAHNIPLFIIETDWQFFIRWNDSRIFHNFDQTLSGHICAIDCETLTKVEQLNKLNHCFENVFMKNLENELYEPAKYVKQEFHQCHFVEALIDMIYPMTLKKTDSKIY